MNTPDNCYLDKGHSAHDLLGPGETCKACGFVAGSVLTQEMAGVANRWELYASHESLRIQRDRLRAAVQAMDALWPEAFAGRWCDECRSGCSDDSDEIAHYPECKRKAYETARAAVGLANALESQP
jgi:hypothetical protein